MKQLRLIRFALGCAILASAGSAGAGAPQPDQRSTEFAHVCAGGTNRSLPCTTATQDIDCPRSQCVVSALSRPIVGTLTLIADDTVSDWANGGTPASALTVMLEVRAPDGSRQRLAATYQNLAAPINPPQAPGNVVAIAMDEAALQTLGRAVSGLVFAQPDSTLTAQLQSLFATTGTPVIVAVGDRRVEAADHAADDLATVLRFKVKLQFVEPL